MGEEHADVTVEEVEEQIGEDVKEEIKDDVKDEDGHRTTRDTEDNDWPDENAEDAPIVYVVNSLG